MLDASGLFEDVNPQAKQILKKRTKIIINPPLKEDNINFNPLRNTNGQTDPDLAVSDPYKLLGKPDASIELKDLAFKIIKARSYDESQEYKDLLEYEEEYDETMEELDERLSGDQMKPAKKKSSAGKRLLDTVKKQGMVEGKQWHVDHPANHMNIVNAYLDTNKSEKEFGKNWYSDAHNLTKFLSKGTGHTVATVAGVIANHSPQNGIHQNYHDAVRVLDAGKGLGGKGSGIMAQERQAHVDDKMFAGMHHSEALKGNKTKAFAHLLEHGHQTDPSNPRVVIDRHAHSVVSGARITDNAFGMAGMKRKGRYQELEHHYLNASEHLERHHGIKVAPEQLQAATWAHRQRKNQEEENARGSDKTAKHSGANEHRWNEFSSNRFAGHKVPPVPGNGFVKKEKPEHDVPTRASLKVADKNLKNNNKHIDSLGVHDVDFS